MTNTKLNLKELSSLLSRFFDNNFDIPDEILLMSGKFIFENAQFTESDKYSDLLDTLEYLKDVKERNHIKDLNGLLQYYEKKQRRIDELFDRFEAAEAEERLAIKFQAACKTFLIVKASHKAPANKEECLYYPTNSDNSYIMGFENISYSDSIELEKMYLAQIKGNVLIKQQNISGVPSEKNNQTVSN
jgi:hypothetical protein